MIKKIKTSENLIKVCLVLAISVLAACGNHTSTSTSTSTTTTDTSSVTASPAPAVKADSITKDTLSGNGTIIVDTSKKSN